MARTQAPHPDFSADGWEYHSSFTLHREAVAFSDRLLRGGIPSALFIDNGMTHVYNQA